MDFAKVTAEAAEQMQSQKGELGYGFGGNQEVEFTNMMQPGVGTVGVAGVTDGDGLGDRNKDADMDKANNIITSQTSIIKGKK